MKALFYLSESYYAASDLERARNTIATAAAIAPDDPQICQKYGQYLATALETRRDGLTWLTKARRFNPNLADIDFQIAKTEFDLTDYASAISNLEAALKHDPHNGQAAFYLAESLGKLGDWERARDQYSYALAHGFVTATAYYGLAIALIEVGHPADSISPLEHSLQLQPSLIQAHFQLGKAYQQMGRNEDAGREIRLFRAMNGRVDTTRELGSTDDEKIWVAVKPLIEQNKESQALDYLKNLPAQYRGDKNPYYLLGAMYFTLGRKSEAIRVLMKAQNQEPSDPQVFAYLGLVELSTGDLRAGEQALNTALKLDSRNALALSGIGALRYQQQRWDEAIDFLERSRTADPVMLYMLCDAYFRVGKDSEANLAAELVRAFGPNRNDLLTAVNELVSSHARVPQANR